MGLFQVRLSQVREEKVSEERSKKKLSKKPWESDVRKQKILKLVRTTPRSLLQVGKERNPCTGLPGGTGSSYCQEPWGFREIELSAARFMFTVNAGLEHQGNCGDRYCPTGDGQAVKDDKNGM